MRKIAVPFCTVPNSPSPIVPFLPLLRLLLPLFPRLLIIAPQILSDADDYAGEVRHCSEADLLFQYTPCDQNNKRWLYAVPRSHNFLCSADSVPAPRHGLNCSVICPAGHFLEMHSQKCEQCKPGTYSLGDRLRYEQFEGDKLPDGFSVENSPADESLANLFGGNAMDGQCQNGGSGGGWAVEENELRYRWTHCESTLSIALHLVRPGFAEFRYRISRDSRGLISLLRVRNAQCQSYGGNGNEWHGTPKQRQKQRQQQKQSETQSSPAEGDIRVQRLALRTGQNLITWSVSSDPVLSTRMEMIRLLRLDLSGLAFTPECSACPAGTFSDRHGAQQCDPCPMNTFSTAGARRCAACATHQWAEPRSEMCQLKPKCQPLDYHPVRPQHCNGTRRVYQRKIEPTVCLDEPGAYTALSELEQCPPCALGMHRNVQSGECQKCPEGEISEDGKVCQQCPANSQPAFGLFINRWDSFPPGVVPKFECEFVSADESAGDCRVSPAWISHGDRVESVQTRFTSVALEMSIHLSDGFYAPLHSGRVSADNPLALIAVELELICEDDTCQFYIVQEFDTPASSVLLSPATNGPRRELQMLALLNGTQPRRVLQVAAVTTDRPRRLVFAFMRSGTVLGRDSLSDRAVLYAINVTNTGDAQQQRSTGTAYRCVNCPRRDARSGKCLPCPPGEYWSDSSCHRCPHDSVLNPAVVAQLQSLPAANVSSSASSPASPCVPCPPHFVGSADGFACEFSGHFDMDEESDREAEEGRDGEGRKKSKTEAEGQRMHFDISALRETTLTARGIRVFSRDGQSYSHVFNVSLFSDRPMHCRDTLSAGLSNLAEQTQPTDEEGTNADEEAMFCRWAAVPIVPSADHSKNLTPLAAELFVSSTIISRKLALLTRKRRFGAFHLSDDQLEYDSGTPRDRLPLDVHFFFQPSSPSSSSALFPSNCPNGTLGVVTVRCEPNVVAKPLARLSRHCPDGTCDGCLYHVLVETVHGCPLCRADDFREVRGECIDGSQRVHSIPSKHCALSGAQMRERTEPCRVILSQNVRLLLAVAVLLILLLSLFIAAIYRRNKALEYRYMRLMEGRDVDQSTRTSCALIESDVDGSEEEEEEGGGREQQGKKQSRGPRVFFSVRKGTKSEAKGNNATAHKRLGGAEKYGGNAGKVFSADERTEFIAEEEESD